MKKFTTLLLIIFVASMGSPINALSVNETRLEVQKVFIEAQKAEKNGANITEIIKDLNTAIHLLEEESEENITRASNIISSSKTLISQKTIEANANSSMQTYVSIIITGFLILVGFIVLRYGSKLYWGIWLRKRGDWRVERT